MQLPTITDHQRQAIERLAELDTLRGDLKGALADVSPALRDAVGLRVVGELPLLGDRHEAGYLRADGAGPHLRGLKRLAESLDRKPITEGPR